MEVAAEAVRQRRGGPVTAEALPPSPTKPLPPPGPPGPADAPTTSSPRPRRRWPKRRPLPRGNEWHVVRGHAGVRGRLDRTPSGASPDKPDAPRMIEAISLSSVEQRLGRHADASLVPMRIVDEIDVFVPDRSSAACFRSAVVTFTTKTSLASSFRPAAAGARNPVPTPNREADRWCGGLTVAGRSASFFSPVKTPGRASHVPRRPSPRKEPWTTRLDLQALGHRGAGVRPRAIARARPRRPPAYRLRPTPSPWRTRRPRSRPPGAGDAARRSVPAPAPESASASASASAPDPAPVYPLAPAP